MLTTDDLISTTFTTTRLREGYEMSEVDEFLEHTTQTLRHRDQEIRDLRTKLDASTSARPAASDETTTVDGSRAAARLLEIAARNADELLAESKAEADSTVATAQAEADQLTAAAQAEAHQVTASARASADQALAEARAESERVHAELERSRADQIEELNRHRTTVLSELRARQTALETEVRRLEQLDADHRDRMRNYLTQQLAQIEPTTTD